MIFFKTLLNTYFLIPGRKLDNISQIPLIKYCSICKKTKGLYSRPHEGIRAVLEFLLISDDFPCAVHACASYACMCGCICPYRIDIHERADCRHDAIKRITILCYDAPKNTPRTTLHYS